MEVFLPLEPFGLFNFLQSLLQTPQNSNEPPLSDAVSDESVFNEETPQITQEREENTDAILQFIEAHDRRSKRIKK